MNCRLFLSCNAFQTIYKAIGNAENKNKAKDQSSETTICVIVRMELEGQPR